MCLYLFFMLGIGWVRKILLDERVWVFHTLSLSCPWACDLCHSSESFSIGEVIEICTSAIARFVNECEYGELTRCFCSIWGDGSFSHLARFIVCKIVTCYDSMLKYLIVWGRDGSKRGTHRNCGITVFADDNSNRLWARSNLHTIQMNWTVM